MRDGAPAREVRAAGAVLWRYAADGTTAEVAVIHRPRYDDWSLPKGKANPGEHPLVNAVREVTEETGVRPVLGRPLGYTRYEARGRPKRVDYWAATPAQPAPSDPLSWAGGHQFPNGCAGGLPDDQFAFVPGDEVDKLEWMPVPAAAARLSYPRDAGILRAFSDGPAATVPYIFVRHASAGRKGSGPADLLRPVDDAGIAQAWELAKLLACFGSAHAISSATARCVETLLPYALVADSQVIADPALTWGAGDSAVARDGREADAAHTRLAVLLANRIATIVCGHGETLPALFAQACAHFGAPVPEDPALQKAAFWIVHAAAAGERHFAVVERHAVG